MRFYQLHTLKGQANDRLNSVHKAHFYECEFLVELNTIFFKHNVQEKKITLSFLLLLYLLKLFFLTSLIFRPFNAPFYSQSLVNLRRLFIFVRNILCPNLLDWGEIFQLNLTSLKEYNMPKLSWISEIWCSWFNSNSFIHLKNHQFILSFPFHSFKS